MDGCRVEPWRKVTCPSCGFVSGWRTMYDGGRMWLTYYHRRCKCGREWSKFFDHDGSEKYQPELEDLR